MSRTLDGNFEFMNNQFADGLSDGRCARRCINRSIMSACCDQDSICCEYSADTRNCFWPEFCHPRWLACGDLYKTQFGASGCPRIGLGDGVCGNNPFAEGIAARGSACNSCRGCRGCRG